MPFGKSTLAAPAALTAEAVAAARFANLEHVSYPSLARACPGEAGTAVAAAVNSLKRGRGDDDVAETVVVCGAKRRKSARFAGVPGRVVAVCASGDAAGAAGELDAVSFRSTYAVAPAKAAALGALWDWDRAEGARLMADDGAAGDAFRSSAHAAVRLEGLNVGPAKDWADPTGEKAARAKAAKVAKDEQAKAHGGALPSGLFGGGSKSGAPKKKASSKASKKKGPAPNMGTFFSGGGSKAKSPDKAPEPKKKRRVIEMDDEEDDDDEPAGPPDEPEPAPESAEPAPVAEPEAAAEPEVEEKKPGKKLVEKTFVDEHGYFVTTNVWEDVDDEPDAPKSSLTMTAGPKPKKAAPAAPKPPGLPKPKAKAAKPLKKGQTSLMGFFGKKK